MTAPKTYAKAFCYQWKSELSIIKKPQNIDHDLIIKNLDIEIFSASNYIFFLTEKVGKVKEQVERCFCSNFSVVWVPSHSEIFLLRKEMNDTEISLPVIALDLHFFFFYLSFSRAATNNNEWSFVTFLLFMFLLSGGAPCGWTKYIWFYQKIAFLFWHSNFYLISWKNSNSLLVLF